jgi:hypothetical protein
MKSKLKNDNLNNIINFNNKKEKYMDNMANHYYNWKHKHEEIRDTIDFDKDL